MTIAEPIAPRFGLFDLAVRATGISLLRKEKNPKTGMALGLCGGMGVSIRLAILTASIRRLYDDRRAG